MGSDIIKREKPVNVTASDIGQAARCPYALYLAKAGHVPNWRTRRARKRGIEQHVRWTRSREPDRASRRRGRAFMMMALVVVLVALLILRS